LIKFTAGSKRSRKIQVLQKNFHVWALHPNKKIMISENIEAIHLRQR